jgi:hypothetical protein
MQVKDDTLIFNNKYVEGGSSIWVNTDVILHYSGHNFWARGKKMQQTENEL